MGFVKSYSGGSSMERRGYYQSFGGQYVPEVLMNALGEMENEHLFVAKDQCFTKELDFFNDRYSGRMTPLYLCRLLSKKYGQPDIYIKREDLAPGGAGCASAIAGQIIIGKRIGKRCVLAAPYDLDQALLVSSLSAAMGLANLILVPRETCLHGTRAKLDRMSLQGSRIRIIEGGWQKTQEAAADIWAEGQEEMVFVRFRADGPHPYPLMIREYQKIIGQEIRIQLQEAGGKYPRMITASAEEDACAIGAFYPWLADGDETVGNSEETHHPEPHYPEIHHPVPDLLLAESVSRPLYTKGTEGIGDGMRSLFLLDEQDMPQGPGAEPELASYIKEGRLKALPITEEDALDAALEFARTEGILPSRASSYAAAALLSKVMEYGFDDNVVVVFSGKAEKAWIDACLRREAEHESDS